MSDYAIPDNLRAAAAEARRVLVLTGAGISAESGVPTFRDAQTGLWARYEPQQLATPEAFREDPGLVWAWYRWRRELLARAEPNPAHYALTRWQHRRPALCVVTQNVDGLHQRAGTEGVVELHGSLARTLCSAEGCVVERWTEPDEGAPQCPRCGACLRPAVVWFGESLPEEAVTAALRATEEAELVLSVGTSSLVQPAASLPLEALRRGVPVAEINPTETPLSTQAAWSVRGPAAEVLPALVDSLDLR